MEDANVVDVPHRTRREYKNPPIVEAICGFRFDQDPWNITTPGLIYEQIRAEYPDAPEERPIIQANMSADSSLNATQLSIGAPVTQVAFRNGSKILSVAPQNVAVHSLAPYEGWDELKPRALRALAAYKKVVPNARVTGLNLRYVNRVFIPKSKFSFGEYFTVAQALPPSGFPGSITSFFDRMESAYDDAPVRIVFTWASEDSATQQASFILDFDLTRSEEINESDLEDALDDLRERERAAFESLIRDSLRGIFDAVD